MSSPSLTDVLLEWHEYILFCKYLYAMSRRVGDSPIPGAGAYADTEVGAAAATGKVCKNCVP